MIRKSKLLTAIALTSVLTMTACTFGSNVGDGNKNNVTGQATIIDDTNTNPDDENKPDIGTVGTLVEDDNESGDLCQIDYYYYYDDFSEWYVGSDGYYIEEFMAPFHTVYIGDDTKYPKLKDAIEEMNKNRIEEVLLAKENSLDSWEEYYNSMLELDPEYKGYPWSEITEISVTRADDKLFSLSDNSSSYAGGAHPASYYYGHTYDSNTGKELKIGDIVKEDADVATAIADQIWNVYDDHEMFFSSTKEELRANIQEIIDGGYLGFYVTNDGVTFLFSPYLIAPYASGCVQVDISYAENPGLYRDELFENAGGDYVIHLRESMSFPFEYKGTKHCLGYYTRQIYDEYYDTYTEERDYISFSDNMGDNWLETGDFDIYSAAEPELYIARKNSKYYLYLLQGNRDPGWRIDTFAFEDNKWTRISEGQSYGLQDFRNTDNIRLCSVIFCSDIPTWTFTNAYIGADGTIELTDGLFLGETDEEAIDPYCIFTTMTEVNGCKTDSNCYPTDEAYTIEKGSEIFLVGEIGNCQLFKVNGKDIVAVEYEYDDTTYTYKYDGVEIFDWIEINNMGWE